MQEQAGGRGGGLPATTFQEERVEGGAGGSLERVWGERVCGECEGSVGVWGIIFRPSLLLTYFL